MGALAEPIRNAILNALARGAAFVIDEVWLKLHIGDPLADGSGSPAANSTRLQATFGVDAALGTVATTADVTWSAVPATETYTHVSAWSAETGGTFIGSTELDDPFDVLAGGEFPLLAGDFEFTL